MLLEMPEQVGAWGSRTCPAPHLQVFWRSYQRQHAISKEGGRDVRSVLALHSLKRCSGIEQHVRGSEAQQTGRQLLHRVERDLAGCSPCNKSQETTALW
jgi:hypothetical protein